MFPHPSTTFQYNSLLVAVENDKDVLPSTTRHMGKRKAGVNACLENLQKAQLAKKQKRVTVEEIYDNDNDTSTLTHQVHGMNSSNLCNHVLFEIVEELDDELDDGEEDSDDEGDSVDEPEVRELSELEIFSQTLRNAQEAAKAAEHKTQSNRPKRYFGSTDFLKRKAESLPAVSTESESSSSPADTVITATVPTSPVPKAQMDTDAPLVSVQAEHTSKKDDARERVEQMLKDLRAGKKPTEADDDGIETGTDKALNCCQDKAALRKACAKLMVKSKDPKLDVFFRA
ncbi:uncharacterized protein ARMOST_02706 [Armillaria ostoyae]|uniref:Uncharacterized protein n=1 Tax=Armillaria ostoyae TaxID=47428 RepID=A0A284QSE7_ARMOS|nr:uncharacterized protein ARMOST_02706 [Armillaria ostoyae]